MRKKISVLLLVSIVLMFAGCKNTGPAIAREETPEWAGDHVGMWGMVRDYSYDESVAEPPVGGIDFWQSQHFIIYNSRTAPHLYDDYTPLQVNYKKGTLPVFEQIVEKYTAGLTTDKEKAMALLTKAMPDTVRHIAIPPVCQKVKTDRALSDTELVKSGNSWCNEQARVFVRLCQVAGFPARMIFLFYSSRKDGHVISEFYADGQWSMADSSYFIAFPAPDGRLMSAAKCHDDGPGQDLAGKAYLARMKEILAYSDHQIARYAVPADLPEDVRRQKIAERAAISRKWLRGEIDDYYKKHLWVFGVLNYPLPNK